MVQRDKSVRSDADTSSLFPFHKSGHKNEAVDQPEVEVPFLSHTSKCMSWESHPLEDYIQDIAIVEAAYHHSLQSGDSQMILRWTTISSHM